MPPHVEYKHIVKCYWCGLAKECNEENEPPVYAVEINTNKWAIFCADCYKVYKSENEQKELVNNGR